MQGSLGQTVIIDNKAGATGTIGATFVKRSAADGYTLFLGTIANTINVSLQPGTSVDLSKELMPVSMIGSVPNILVVNPALGVDTMDQLLAKAKAEPGRITYASSGNGTSPHLSGELFGSMAGVRMLHVPYKGSSPAVVDLLAGQVASMFSPASTVLPHIRSGKLKALAVTTKKRLPALSLVPTMAESGFPEFEMVSWYGLWAPANLPPAISKQLAEMSSKAMNSKSVRDLLVKQGFVPELTAGDQFAGFLTRELAQYSRIVRISNIQID
jgi:tripartite-type tricarboxylate transporter receptor subunit TctC